MVGWKEVRITDKTRHDSYIRFRVDGYIGYSGGTEWWIDCKTTLPFTEWKEGDEIQIDIEKARSKSSGDTFSFYDNIVFKSSTSTSTALVRVQSDYSSLQS